MLLVTQNMLKFKMTASNSVDLFAICFAFPLLCFMLVDFNLPIHSANFHRGLSLILVCSLKLKERYICGVKKKKKTGLAL